MDVPILYEDNHLLLVQKPVNIPVQGDQSGDKDLLTYLKEDIKYRYQKPGNVYLGLVHRLDRPVGGAMVFAKTSKAASRLSDLVRRNDMGRTYYAVVHGRPKQASNRLVDYLYKNRQKNIVSIVSKNHKEGKKAVLSSPPNSCSAGRYGDTHLGRSKIWSTIQSSRSADCFVGYKPYLGTPG